MITRSKTTVGFQCPVCGRIQTRELNAFAVGKEKYQLNCRECQRPFGELIRDEKQCYHMSVVCIDCLTPHTFKVKCGDFWHSRLKTFDCPNGGEMIFAIGEKEQVAQTLEENFYLEEEELAEQGRTPAAGVVADFMAVIEHFKYLSQEGRLTCECANPQIQLKVGEGCIELSCVHCGRSRLLDVSSRENMLAIQKMASFHLT